MEYMNILKSSFLAYLQWISFFEKLSLQSTFLSYQSLGGVHPAEGWLIARARGILGLYFVVC